MAKQPAWNSIIRFEFVKKTSAPNPAKRLGYISATIWLVPDLIKAQALLSYRTVRWSEVEQNDLKPYWNLSKRPCFLWRSVSLLFTRFLRILLAKTRTAAGFTQYLWKFGFIVLQNHYWNKIRIRHFWGIKAGYNFQQLQIYRSNTQIKISSRRDSM